MSAPNRLVGSIVLTVGSLFAFQGVLFAWLVAAYGIDIQEVFHVLIVLLLVHAALLVFLMMMRHSFILLPSRRKLERINFTNILTLTRISSTPTILYLLIFTERYPVIDFMVVFTSLVFVTDLLDGAISRCTGQITRIGQYLDSMSDYAVLIAISIAYVHFSLVPPWFFRLVMARLLIQWIGMGLLLIVRGQVEPKATRWGKISVFATMTLYATALIRMLDNSPHLLDAAYPLIEIVIAAILSVSIIEKGYVLALEFRHAFGRKPQSKQRS